jgi:hypothetical protein
MRQNDFAQSFHQAFMNPAHPVPADSLRCISDEQLLEQCRWETFRGPGPGGQKRNKTSSAVRLVHLPTGLSALAAESRSQAANRRRALARLRLRLAVELRQPVDTERFTPPPWWENVSRDGRLVVSAKSEWRMPAVGLALDVLAATHGAVGQAAALLGVNTAQLVQFLAEDRLAWAAANALRAGAGLKPLR